MTDNLIIADAAEKLFKDLLTPVERENALQGVWPASLWKQLGDTGLLAAATAEKRGGSGLTTGGRCAIAKAAGKHALPAPMIESFLAEQALAAADLPVVTGIAGIISPSRHGGLVLSRRNGRVTLSGKTGRIPWGRYLNAVVAIAQDEGTHTTVCLQGPFLVTKSENIPGEPSDSMAFDHREVPSAQVGAQGKGLSPLSLRAAGALYRCSQMVGAMQTVLEMTTLYAKQREQFGRPIAKFQAVQQQIAMMASEIVASDCVTSAAVEAAEGGPATFETAAAKSRLGKAADTTIDVAHQIHGAIGTTRDFALHHFTMRLALWRDEYGSSSEWSDWIGQLVCANGGAALWPYLTAKSR